ncbi:MAG: L-serine ammonia-lyase, partial [Acidobacteriota bacterium]|nr:L-serine ammonia-lyase [Acidobacteriota bacterium]
MNTSLFELFKIGIGPSSSHTVGPMRAALRFVRELEAAGVLEKTARVTVDLYGSLALTGVGHGTDRAVLLGLMGEAPDSVDPALVDAKIAEVRAMSRLMLGGRVEIPFCDGTRGKLGVEESDLRFRRSHMYPEAGVVSHPNGMRFAAFDAAGGELAEEVFYSVGGGFIVSEAERLAELGGGAASTRVVPYPYRSAAELLRIAGEHQLTIAKLVLANECALLADEQVQIVRPVAEVAARSSEDQVCGSVMMLWRAMDACAQRGMEIEGILPGGLKVRRRAPGLAKRLREQELGGKTTVIYKPDPLAALDWVTMWAMAVNEENAAGGRVVTAPTNGAAGVIPAIALYYLRFLCERCSDAEKEAGLLRYFLTAAAIGILYKENASISGAEVGCQGEVGVACSMAAGGLVAAQHGTNGQVEHAAEIAMEHNLGMTCDPIGGLVQIPCIERNGMGAVKAINAARLAVLHGDGSHRVPLDRVIETMRQT